jgi:hypothetical protein
MPLARSRAERSSRRPRRRGGAQEGLAQAGQFGQLLGTPGWPWGLSLGGGGGEGGDAKAWRGTGGDEDLLDEAIEDEDDDADGDEEAGADLPDAVAARGDVHADERRAMRLLGRVPGPADFAQSA